MQEDKYEFIIEELGVGRFVDYETIPYRIDTPVADGELIITPLNHDWQPEKAHISEIMPIRITEPFLLSNNWIKNEASKDLKGKVNDEQSYTFKTNGVMFTLYPSTSELFVNHCKWPKKIKFVHELQNVMVAAGLSIKEMTFLPEFYSSEE